MSITFDNNVHFAYLLEWEESERGWGCRPDGTSIHLSQEECSKYLKEYWERQPKGEAPDEYSRPLNDKPIGVRIPNELHELLQKEKSMRFWRGDLRVLTDTAGSRMVNYFKPPRTPDIIMTRHVSLAEHETIKDAQSVKVKLDGVDKPNVQFTFDPISKELIGVQLIKRHEKAHTLAGMGLFFFRRASSC